MPSSIQASKDTWDPKKPVPAPGLHVIDVAGGLELVDQPLIVRDHCLSGPRY